jgi:hypothetical protein
MNCSGEQSGSALNARRRNRHRVHTNQAGIISEIRPDKIWRARYDDQRALRNEQKFFAAIT